MNELYKRYRPKTLKAVVGQDAAIASIQLLLEKGNLPHTVLFSGPSGCGKTTIARIVKETLGCSDHDFTEVNCADFKGIDFIREVRRSINLRPMSGPVRVWLIDECHMLTKEAQNAFLKMLEDTPSHVYFLLASTDPQKLLKAIITRSAEVKLNLLNTEALRRVVQRVLDKEKAELSEDVMEALLEAAEGSARKALVILEQIVGLEGEKAQLQSIQASTFNKEEAIKLARELLFPQGGGWPACARILRGLNDEDPEGVRWLVLSYARSCLIGKDDKPPNAKFAGRAFKVIEVFSSNFYDTKQAGLAAACYEVIAM